MKRKKTSLLEVRIEILKELGESLGFKTPEDWYAIRASHFKKSKIQSLSSIFKYQYNSSARIAAKELFPKYDFKDWLFHCTPKGYWDEKLVRVEAMQWLGNKLGYKYIEDWYNVTCKDFEDNGLSGMLVSKYNDSPQQALFDLFPNNNFLPWKFACTPNGYWQDKNNRIKYMKWLGDKYNFKNPEDWYQLTENHFKESDGSAILNILYRIGLLKELFPNYNWQGWLFNRVDKNFWNNEDNRINFIQWLSLRLDIKSMDQWYEVTKQDFENNYAAGLIDYYGTQVNLLQSIFPDYQWDIKKLQKTNKNQIKLYNIVKSIFPNVELINNYKSDNLRFKDSAMKMELDIFIPSLNIAFEYDGEWHYMPYHRMEANRFQLERQQQRDKEKNLACEQAGIKLYRVHYSWDGSKEAIEKIIKSSLHNSCL